MKPIKVNWNIQLPTQKQIEKMWEELQFDIVDGDFEFVNLLKENIVGEDFNGDLYFKGFRFYENEIFDWFCSRGRLDEIDFYEKFLLSEKVLKTFQISENDYLKNGAYQIDKKPDFIWKSAFVIDGELASLLYHGGVYGSKYKKEPKLIKQKTIEFCNQLFNEKYSCEYVRYYTSYKAWNSWFNNFIIDITYLIICMKTRTMWVLAFTDAD